MRKGAPREKTQDDHAGRCLDRPIGKAIGAPASAALGKGTIGIVNGIPGQRVDICIKGKEIKSRVAYGGRAFRTLTEGSKLIKIFKPDPRKCKGVKLAQKRIELAAGDDWTIVINRHSPKFIMFDNTGLGTIPPDGPDFVVAFSARRHAAELGAVNFLLGVEAPIGPAFHPVWHQGDQALNAVGGGASYRLRATRPDKTKTLAKSNFVELKASRRYEWYLLGTKAKNAKFIVWSRAISLPIP